MSGLFGSLFDFNGDGELSTGEKAFGFAAIMSALSALEDAEVSVSCSFDDEDLDDMDRDELEAKLEELRDERNELDDQEPDDPCSDAYDEWEERCEDLDEKIEEIEELLEDQTLIALEAEEAVYDPEDQLLLLYAASGTNYEVSRIVRANADSMIKELAEKGFCDMTQFTATEVED